MKFLAIIFLTLSLAASLTAQSTTARVSLTENDEIKALQNADPLGGSNMPNYLKALANTHKPAQKYANLLQTVIFGGTVKPAAKMLMAWRIGQIYHSDYLMAHAARWLKATPDGAAALKALASGATGQFSAADQLAILYAELLTRDIHGVSDADFGKVRGFYNDSQIVELTMTVCFFNHFTRLVESLKLPVESWVTADKTPQLTAHPVRFAVPTARVGLISDAEMNATTNAVNAAKDPQKPASGLGLGIANSQRAMLRVPDLAQAWREFGAQVRENSQIDRNLQLQVSFAVSMANGCRYCTLHQVLGLRRLGVDMAKLVAMKKDDAALTKPELIAVQFARKSTAAPASITDADFAALKTTFGEQGAVEVVLQTGAFAFMNRFTDGLRLPSEDEAVKIYQETYGDGTYQGNWKKNN